MSVVGLLLAAGAGRRMGTPKALVRDDDGTPWLHRSLRALRDGGCAPLVVVLGAAHEEAARLLAGAPDLGDVEVVVAADWDEGMGASLRAGATYLTSVSSRVRDVDSRPSAALVHLVDLPDVGPAVVARVVAAADDVDEREERSAGTASSVLARAAYAGVAGHPVLIGADHWAGVVASAQGDAGARAYLARHTVALVECGDLATGEDRDTRS